MIIQYGEIKKEQNSHPKAIRQLRETLEEEQPELEEYLLELWDKQQQEITAQQYINIVKKGNLTKEIEDKLLKSYSIFVLGKMLDKKETVMRIGAKEVKKPLFSFDIKYHETKKWIEKDCAEKIVQLSEMQKEAIKLVIDRAETLGFTADTTADLLRPMIGLHKGQVTANINYYNNIKKNLLESNPRMKEATAEKRALEKAKQYAEKQRTYRAMTIARTELAGAYNAGEFYGIKQAQKEGLMGKTKKYPISAGDGRVCRGCKDVEGQEVDINDYFETQWGKVLFPPFHTSCRCAMGYEEVSETLEAPEILDPKIKAANEEFNQILLEGEDTTFKKNMIFYSQTTEYQLNENLDAAFAYKPALDVIQYNPNTPNYELYDMNFVQAHELAHKMDILEYRSWENKNFVKAVDNTKKIVYNYVDEIKTWFIAGGKYEDDMALSDIISALTEGDLNDILYTKHEKDYWLKDKRLTYLEIFANISSIDILNSKSKVEFKKLLREIYAAYKELVR